MMPSRSEARRVVFVANSMYSRTLSGGDIHTLNMVRGALEGGYDVEVLAGHALGEELQQRHPGVNASYTDKQVLPPYRYDTLSGQFKMLADYLVRLRGTFRQLDLITERDIAYANTDFWWDTLPVLFSRAERKAMILGMDCPTLSEIVLKARPDVKSARLPSLHYWISQNLALRLFRRCRSKRVLYVHPNQRQRLLRLGYPETELAYVSNGFDLHGADEVPAQEKVYDAVWTGRVHQQKGIDDLLSTLGYLAKSVPDFRAVLIGNVESALAPRVRSMGLGEVVRFSGFVSESEKFRLLKASRLFLMPSRYESWGIVIAEALASGVPVLAYDLAAYRPVFGNLVRYVPSFDARLFMAAALDEITRVRSGTGGLPSAALEEFKRENSWQAAGKRFVKAMDDLSERG